MSKCQSLVSNVDLWIMKGAFVYHDHTALKANYLLTAHSTWRRLYQIGSCTGERIVFPSFIVATNVICIGELQGLIRTNLVPLSHKRVTVRKRLLLNSAINHQFNKYITARASLFQISDEIACRGVCVTHRSPMCMCNTYGYSRSIATESVSNTPI